jgi:dipicolinate synthase subunit A
MPVALERRLDGVRVAILGGDRRELVVADRLAAAGADVRAVGLPWPDPVSYTANRLEDAVAWADVVVAPVGGTDEVGHIAYTIVAEGEFPGPRLTEDVVARMRAGTLLVIGSARPPLEELCARYGVRLVAYRERDEFAILNSIPSAEGAIALAMEASDLTVHGSESAVLGYGRLGTVLASMLRGLGAHTTVVARSQAERARAVAAGHRGVAFPDLPEVAARADMVFNTVPAPVLGQAVLERLDRHAVVIDLASAPGGTDFAAAKRMGVRARLAPGLPGLVAPRTAGDIEADMVLSILAAELR